MSTDVYNLMVVGGMRREETGSLYIVWEEK
jgi:hypothetical protein